MNEGTGPEMASRKMKLIRIGGYLLVLVLAFAGIFSLYILLQSDVSDEPVEHECDWRGGTFSLRVLNSSSVELCFGKIPGNPKPTDFAVVLVRNETDEGLYGFQSDDDGPLVLTSGSDVGSFVYADSEDNERVNLGDKIDITRLYPGSSYEILLYWAPTGSLITKKTFSTPYG